MKKYTKKQHEQYLNELYADAYALGDVLDKFNYLLSSNRTKPIRERTLVNAYANHELGSLLRKHDCIAFEVSYNDRCRDLT